MKTSSASDDGLINHASADASRRAFLRRSGQLALTGTALPFALNLAAFGDAAAADATDYKALVCVFMAGGNDYANTVVTYDDTSYNQYNAIRNSSGIALTKASLTPTLLSPTVALPNGRQYALNGTMTGLAGLFNSGKAAVQLNVGPLVVPLTRTQYTSGAYAVPPKLMSHNDQASVWQSSAPEGAPSGWGGRIGDLVLSSNGNATFTCISAAGNAIFVSGQSAIGYGVSTGGALAIAPIKSSPYGQGAVQSALATLIQQSRSHVIENEYNRVTARSIAAETVVTAAIGTGSTVSTVFPANNPLGDQLKVVARLIKARAALGPAKRQVFFVAMGGFDTHDNMNTQHSNIVGAVSDAMTAFYNATVEIGVASQVTSFTASDFGRTLSPNGNGTDHGWGSHHIVVGGAVNGKAFYGTAPPVSITDTAAAADQWHIGSGRLLPSTSVDQYAATLATWFGVADSDLASVLPNLQNFGTAAGRPDYPRTLGFV